MADAPGDALLKTNKMIVLELLRGGKFFLKSSA
jgi:hypothetical protein